MQSEFEAYTKDRENELASRVIRHLKSFYNVIIKEFLFDRKGNKENDKNVKDGRRNLI